MVNMKIDHFVVGPVQTNCYFVTNIKTKEMIIIDIIGFLIVDITKIFTEKEINISGIQSKTSKQGIATIEVFFNIKGRDQIKVLVEKLRQIESVIDVERTTG